MPQTQPMCCERWPICATRANDLLSNPRSMCDHSLVPICVLYAGSCAQTHVCLILSALNSIDHLQLNHRRGTVALVNHLTWQSNSVPASAVQDPCLCKLPLLYGGSQGRARIHRAGSERAGLHQLTPHFVHVTCIQTRFCDSHYCPGSQLQQLGRSCTFSCGIPLAADPLTGDGC